MLKSSNTPTGYRINVFSVFSPLALGAERKKCKEAETKWKQREEEKNHDHFCILSRFVLDGCFVLKFKKSVSPSDNNNYLFTYPIR